MCIRDSINAEYMGCEIYKAKLQGVHNELIPEKLEYRPIQLSELFESSRFCIFSDHTIAMTSKAKFNSEEFIDIFEKLSNLNSPKLAQFTICLLYTSPSPRDQA
eukprot:TRINITY_DN5745_c0_g1_i1.p1 TRINITY_DN5745_c0_g1~~TRINITY_DN5745_c0_g1_i1.p1  ORF type:complete len:104 (-),score=16.18 TRINITY_DN5745_c0_g1_i1:134-445(-)